MKNPWIDFVSNIDDKNLVLKQDNEVITKFNKKVDSKFQVHTEIMPAPFMGNIQSSPIVLLTLNPGYDQKEADKNYYNTYKHYWKQQIQHVNPIPDLPLFCLENTYKQYSNYWDLKLKPLIAVSSVEKVAKKVSIIQLFPYHTEKFKPVYKSILNGYLESQQYNFYLVKKAIERNAIIIIVRSRKLWYEAIPELKDYELDQKKLFQTNSYLNPILSEKNLPNAFPVIKEVLNSTH